MQTLYDVTNVAHVIQLAVAPVFLLTGVGAILGVLVNRLGRIVDRFRTLERIQPDELDAVLAVIKVEMAILSRRARMVHWAIGLCTGSALLVCILIATLFIGAISNLRVPEVIAALFVLAMLSLVTGLLCFLREIALSTGNIHVIVPHR